MHRFLKTKEAAELLGCSCKTIYRLALDGEIHAFWLRGRGELRITGRSLVNFIRRQCADPLVEPGDLSGLENLTDKPTKGLLTIPEAADFLNTSRDSIYRLMAEGHLRSVKFGNSRRVLHGDIDKYIRGRMVAYALWHGIFFEKDEDFVATTDTASQPGQRN